MKSLFHSPRAGTSLKARSPELWPAMGTMWIISHPSDVSFSSPWPQLRVVTGAYIRSSINAIGQNDVSD
ncbi:hypothetical protein I7I48_03570 [Histoplasma ohiense]|nr:hypothetical protein I7I48_03570 [Histoplasma ohiense (nom. inval.)]